MRNAIKRLLYWVLCLSGCHILFKWLNRHRVMILMYHGLLENGPGAEWTQLPVSRFEKQMQYISKHFHPVTLSDAVEYLAGRRSIPQNPVVITFDDGYGSVFTAGNDILRKLNIPATVFITTSFVADEGESADLLWFDYIYKLVNDYPHEKLDLSEHGLGCYDLVSREDRFAAGATICDSLKQLDTDEKHGVVAEIVSAFHIDADNETLRKGASWKQIREAYPLVQAAAHTINHEILTRLPLEEASREIAGSKQIIEQKANCSVRFFAYPNGRREDFSAQIKEEVRRAGFDAALTTIEGPNRPGDDLFELKRIGVGSDAGMRWFRLAVTGTIESLKSWRAGKN